MHIAHTLGYFMDDVPCSRGSGLSQMRGVVIWSQGVYTPVGGLYNILDVRTPPDREDTGGLSTGSGHNE